MPNWAEGSLKIRGPIKNIKRFLDEGIQKKALNTFGKEMDEDIVTFTDWSDECGIECEYHFVGTSHIKHTFRAFIDPEIVNGEYAYISGESTENIDTIALPFKQAWRAEAKSYEEISKEYEIDISIHTFEKGAEFEQDILIEGGKIVKDEIIEYDDYRFESAMPMLGG